MLTLRKGLQHAKRSCINGSMMFEQKESRKEEIVNNILVLNTMFLDSLNVPEANQ